AGDLVEINVSEDPHYHVATDRLSWRPASKQKLDDKVSA
ncbi:MAG: hypothetical protein ACI87E_004722, partial [Mariniblastus sp.]